MSEKTTPETTEKTGQAVAESRLGSGLRPFGVLDEWFDELQRHWLAHSPLARGLMDFGSTFGGRAPRVDVIDREGEVCVRAELPGVSKDDLSITLQDNLLNIHAKVEKEDQDEKGTYHRREMFRGEFQRTVLLPAPVDEEQAKASFRDGVLELVLPKTTRFTPRKIKVE